MIKSIEHSPRTLFQNKLVTRSNKLLLHLLLNIDETIRNRIKKTDRNEFVASSDDRMPLCVLFLMSVEFMCVRIPAVSV